ncbi:site-specific DNA-methyltransferase [Undibacterium sp. GrIS 1.2]|uniref:site-specific DNA-methyltransferase n=1 Tax=Undibacterium sp. GrIS 1.2 TaxID=3143933 RepID=UPI0033952B60
MPKNNLKAKPSQAKPSQAKPSQAKPSQAKPKNNLNLIEELLEVLLPDDRLVSEGRLSKNKITELALNLDPLLLKLLLDSENLRHHFFSVVGDIFVFDKIKFQRLVSNKQFLPDSYTAFKNKIGLVSDDEYLSNSKEVVLAWPYKDCVLEGGQDKDDSKRNEVFWNEVLAPDQIDRLLSPKALLNWKRYSEDGEVSVGSISGEDNLLIKGNNLLALHTIKKTHEGKVKLIYIDPPYNTDTDSFKYNDSFNHSTWLTFMKNRLEIAKHLLRMDGLIFVQIDDTEAPYLKVLCDEVFGKENAIINMYVQVRFEGKTLVEDMNFQKLIETTLVYGRSALSTLNKQQEEYSKADFCWEIVETGKPKEIELGGRKVHVFKQGTYEIHKALASEDGLKEIWASGKILDGNSSGRFFRDYLEGRSEMDGLGSLYKVPGIGDDGLSHRYFTGPKRPNATKGKYYQGMPKHRRGDGGSKTKFLPIPNFYQMAESFGNCRHEGGVDFRNGKKPEVWLSKILELATRPNDLVVDFFVGSGSTCAVAHKMGRRYIGIEQMDYIDTITKKRLMNVVDGDNTGISKLVEWQGGGEFLYCELAKANQTYVESVQAADTDDELIAIWLDMQDKAFLSYKVNVKLIDDKKDDFQALSIRHKKQFLMDVMDKNLLYVPLSEIDDKSYGISKSDKAFNSQFFKLGKA